MATETMEVWVAVEGYAGLYEISNTGKCRSLDRRINTIRGTRLCKGKLLKPQMNSRGYLQVSLCKDGKVKHFLLHRLVAAAFCEQSAGCDIVNHRDSNPSNCEADNLEFTDHKGNTLHAILENRIVSRAVIRSDGKYYPILSMVKDDGFYASAVTKCCNGEQREHKGYGWNYACVMENGSYGRIRRFRLMPESCAVSHRTKNQNIHTEEGVKKLSKKANILMPEVGMQAVFVPTIHGVIEKNEPRPPVQGRVTYINQRHGTFVAEYPTKMGSLRETFKFVDIGSRVRLYPGRKEEEIRC